MKKSHFRIMEAAPPRSGSGGRAHRAVLRPRVRTRFSTFGRRLPKAGSGARSETLPVMTCVAAAATTGHAVPVVIACRARSKCREFSQCSGLVACLGGRALFTFVIARVLRRFPAYTSRHMARLAGRVTVDDVTTLRTTAYRYTSRAQSATREPM